MKKSLELAIEALRYYSEGDLNTLDWKEACDAIEDMTKLQKVLYPKKAEESNYEDYEDYGDDSYGSL